MREPTSHHHEASNGASNRNTNGHTNGVSNGVSNETSKRSSIRLSKRASYGASHTASHEASNGKPHRHLFDDLHAKVRPMAQLIKASFRPMPNKTGDGTYIPDQDLHTSLLEDVSKLGLVDAYTIKDLIKETVKNEPIDDRTYFMEKLVDMAARQPQHSKLGVDLTNALLRQLWDDLEHPPLSYLDEKYKYRQADGSYNNIRYPQLGAANTPYARTVRPKTPLPLARPDPGLLFDSLMARPDGSFTPHPNGISSFLFHLATVIIHDIFYTSHKDQNISQTSSYLDLAPLYGNNEAEQNLVRTFKDGKLKPDVFSEKRILGQPPGAGVLLIMFNRFHNDAATKLALINEGGRFTKPTTDDPAAWAKYDNELFQTARLITSGLYINCILKDYVRTILRMNQTDSLWSLDPRTRSGKTMFGTNPMEGVGNQVSAEFNLVYRWHSAIGRIDEKWVCEAFAKVLGPNAADLSWHDMVIKLAQWEKSIPEEPLMRDFAGMKRNADGSLPDDGLVKILVEGIEDVAGAFGANKVPKILRSVEILGIMQSRRWNLASLNEFRAFFNLKQYESFEEINPDPKVAAALKHLYDTPDKVEIYPGIVAEAAKETSVASGLCPSFTVSRAILSDAVALVRGDRFYTTDYTPRSLTNWGYAESNSDLTVDEGHVFYKLILRAFPQHFEGNSVYAHYPLVIPKKNKEILTRLGRASKYDFGKPKFTPLPTFVTSYDAAIKILDNQKDYHVTWGKAISYLTDNHGKEYGKNFMLSGDMPVNTRSRESMMSVVYQGEWADEVKAFFENMTLELLHRKTYELAGTNMVDIVRDVGNMVQSHFAASMFCLPLKTAQSPKGVFTEEELFLAIVVCFAFIFYNVDVAKSFPVSQLAHMAGQQIGGLMEMIITPFDGNDALTWIAKKYEDKGPLPKFGMHMIKMLLKKGYSVKDAIWSNLLPTCIGMVPTQAQLTAQILYFYLSHEDQSHWKEICRLARLDTPEADDKITHYVMEGGRLASSAGLFREAQKDDVVQDGDQTLKVNKGETLFVDLVTASRDPKAFPDPLKVDPTRPMESYIHYGWGPHSCLGTMLSKVVQMTMLKTIARLDNVRLAPGPQGRIPILAMPGNFSAYVSEDGSTILPLPASLKIQFDGEIPKPTPTAAKYAIPQ